MKASLSTAIKIPNQYLHSDRWAMQQKLDGWRVLVQTGDEIKCLNRDGHPLDIPGGALGQLKDMRTEWTLDAEYLDGEIHIFDIISTPVGDITHMPLRKRLSLLEQLRPKLASPVHIIQTFYGDDKQKFLKIFKETAKEGVIFKHLGAPYIEGKNRKNLKYKFTKNVDCIVIDRDRDSKANFALGMYDGDELREVGMCSALTGDGPKIEVGDVVQVNILYATDSGRLYQPVKPRLRIDQPPEACTLDQLEELKPDREVLS